MTKPAPYPANTRAKGWRFEIDHEQVEQSTTWARTKPEARPWLLMLWLKSWAQIPCGSLPDDHEAIAGLIGCPDEIWQKHMGSLLRGWWLADDGRLYHDTIADRVLAMLGTRGTDRARQDARRSLFEVIRERDGRACVYCGHTKYLTLDHVLPLSRGGDNDEANLVIACRPCNSRKRDRTPVEAGLTFINQSAADRWSNYKKSAGETRSDNGDTRTFDTGTGTGTSNTENYNGLDARASAREATDGQGRVNPETYAIPAPTLCGSICAALRLQGISRTNPGHLRLVALVEAGATLAEFLPYVDKAKEMADPFAYLLGTVEGERKRAKAAADRMHRGPMPAAPEPAWKTQQRARMAQAAGPFAEKPLQPPPTPPTIAEVIDVTARRMG